jgi:formylmethanofuran dehydrogenase subunit B
MPEVDSAISVQQPLADAADRVVPFATCLGCGCTCDDIEIVVANHRIAETRNACPLGAAWFGDGIAPARAISSGAETTAGAAIEAAAALLGGATRPLVYLAPDVSCQAQREAIALADMLGAAIDSVTSATAMPSILAAQERGRAGATLGEVRNRADAIVFWGVDPAARYPRFWTRYAPAPAGVQVPGGRAARTIIAVDIDDARGPADADLRIALPRTLEVATLTAVAAALGAGDRREPANAAGAPGPEALTVSTSTPDAIARHLLAALRAARYVAVVSDAEPSDAVTAAPDPVVVRDPTRASALAGAAQALNGHTRCALVTLRGGGNRNGADAALTSQTGYPAAVDFARGYPRYRPYDGSAAVRLPADADAVLVVGSVALLPAAVRAMIGAVPAVVIGPAASAAGLARARVLIDSGTAGIHYGGTALRMDDVPVPLRPVVPGPADPAIVVRDLRERLFLLPLAATRS